MKYYIPRERNKDSHKKNRKILKQWENEMSEKIELKKKRSTKEKKSSS